MDLEYRSFDDFKDVDYQIWTYPLTNGLKILGLEFSGQAERLLLMEAIIGSATLFWPSDGLILDFRKLHYEWGDLMQNVLWAGSHARFPHTKIVYEVFGKLLGVLPEDFLTCVVVSDACREGLTSLVVQEMNEDPDKWLYECMEDAVGAIEMAMSSYVK